VSRLLDLAHLTARHPTWALERVRTRLDRGPRSTPAPTLGLPAVRAGAGTVEQVLADVCGLDAAEAERLAAAAPIPPGQEDDAVWPLRQPLLRVLYVAVRATRPRRTLEVGVERGYSSTVILAGLADNGSGRLWSIDLPPLGRNAEAATGRLVPPELRDRWELELGPARRLLPRAARAHDPLDLVVLDGDHSYAGQRRELRAVWPHLADGGLIVCDDVWNPAFPEFAAAVGGRARYVARPAGDAIGVLRRDNASR
jgi:predicted O-methyltransferase YrrM